QTLKYEAKDTIPAILERLNGIDKSCGSVAATRSRRRKMSIPFFALVLPAFIVLSSLDYDITGALAASLLLVCGIGIMIWASRCPEKLIDNRYRGAVAADMLRTLARDSGPGASFECLLDFRDSETIVKSMPHPRDSRGELRFYETDWLICSGDLLDGTSATLTATQVRRWAKKRGSSGKTKTKTKSNECLSVRVSYSPEIDAAVHQLRANATDAVMLPNGVALKAHRVKEGGIVLKVAQVPRAEIGKTGRMMLLSLYQVVNLARMNAAKRSA
ncbi:MAG: hypothetical protein ABIZ80_02840, partial [Bryobacteraceae bacterium]